MRAIKTIRVTRVIRTVPVRITVTTRVIRGR
jgi:hypothetical protein